MAVSLNTIISSRGTYPLPVDTDRPTPVLAVVIQMPSPGTSRDGQANYMSHIVPALAEVSGREIHVVALQIGDQPAHEAGVGWEVTRVSPPSPLPDVFSAYLPEHFPGAVQALAEAATSIGHTLGPDTPAWCHGYETGTAVAALAANGHRVIGVAHYLVGIESLHDLAVGDDPVRREAFDSPWAVRLGRTIPQAMRPMTVRWAARSGPWMSALPLPAAIRTQLQKLDQERQLVAHANAVIAVGPEFKRAMNDLYPCTVGRSIAAIAGAPSPPLPAPIWPFPDRPDALRLAVVGRPTGQKGWDYLAEALHRLEAIDATAAARIELVAIGGLGNWSGPFSDYSSRVARSLEALDHVRVANLGLVAHDTVLAHLGAAHALVHPAVFEPLGLVILEAMAAGCLVIAADAAGPRDLLEPPWGHLVPFGDPERRVDHLTDALRTLLTQRATQLDAASLDAASMAARYTWDQCAQQHLEALFPARPVSAHRW